MPWLCGTITRYVQEPFRVIRHAGRGIAWNGQLHRKYHLELGGGFRSFTKSALYTLIAGNRRAIELVSYGHFFLAHRVA